MVDTFAPLDLGEAGLEAEDPAYAWSWASGSRPSEPDGGDNPAMLLQQLSLRTSTVGAAQDSGPSAASSMGTSRIGCFTAG